MSEAMNVCQLSGAGLVSSVGGGACVTCLRHMSKKDENKNKHNIDLAKLQPNVAP